MAALAATSAFAQSTVTIYGRANMMVDNYSATGSAATSSDIAGRNRVADTGSRIGFRVNEDLGKGLRAFAVCETGINIDNATGNGQSGAANANTNNWCSREAHVGIGNGAAELRLGRQNVYWTHGELNQTGANFLGGDVLGAFYAASSGASVAVATRLANTALVQLNRGVAGNFAGSHIYYSTDVGEAKGVAVGTSATTAGQNGSTAPNATGRTMGFKVNYSAGPIVAMADWGKSSDSANLSTSAANADQTSWKAAAGYKYTPSSLVSFNYWNHEREYSLAASQTYSSSAFLFGPVAAASVTGNRKQAGYGINLVHDFGGGVFGYAQYAIMKDAKGTAGAIANTGAKAYMVGVRKDLSKRTGIYAATMQIKNESNNSINFTAGGYASGVSAAGADPKVTHFGIMHNF